MELETTLLVVIAWIIGAGSPGPATLAISATAMEHGRKAGIIIAALKFSDNDIFSRDMAWINYLMTSYRLTESDIQAYITAYYEAASEHLGVPAQMVIDWLGDLAVN